MLSKSQIPSNKRQLLALVVILTVCIIKFFSSAINQFLWNDLEAPHFYWSILGQILYYGIPAFAVLATFHGPGRVLEEACIAKGFLKGALVGFLFTLPMLIGYAVVGRYHHETSLLKIVTFSFKDGFREELFYRAFLFGQLFRHVGWGFFPAVAINGIIFGLSHLYQAHNLSESFGVFGITFGGSIWFAWLLTEWEDNLWVPVFLHFLMNLDWDLFGTDSTVVGDLAFNIPRILTVAASIYLTIKWKRSRSLPLRVKRTNMLRPHGQP